MKLSYERGKLMEVILIRHADPDYKKDTITEKGHQEAKALSLSLKGSRLDNLYVSPLGRAQETCRYIAEALKVKPVTLDWLREIQLDVDLGYAPWDFPGDDYLSRSHLPSPDKWWQGFQIGELLKPPFLKIAEGFDKLMEDYGYRKFGNLYKVERPNEKRIALVAHGGMIMTLLAYLLHWPLPLVYIHCTIDTTGVTRLIWREFDSGYAIPKLMELNGLSHLAYLDEAIRPVSL